MARRKESAFDSEGWRAFHSSKSLPGPGLQLESMPEVAAYLKSMLESLRPGEHVSWLRVAEYIRLTYPDAPQGRGAYKRYAIKCLGWTGN